MRWYMKIELGAWLTLIGGLVFLFLIGKYGRL
jgi:hypothetical protein